MATDWTKVDWSLTNGEIAKILGLTKGTVSMMRSRSGAPKAPISRPGQGFARPEMKTHSAGSKYQHLSVDAWAMTWRFRSPDGEVYTHRNMRDFVRSNLDLFNPDDVVFNSKGRCRAIYGLHYAASSGRAWKGWQCRKI